MSAVTDIQFGIVPRWLLDTHVSDRAVSLYARLAAVFAAGEDTDSWAGLEGLAKITNRSESWVRRGLKELQEVGAITRQRRLGTSTLTTIHRLPPQLRTDSPLAYERTESHTREQQTRPRVNPDQVNPDVNAHSSTTNDKKTTQANPAGFDVFWDRYPRKVGKKAAVRAYQKALDEDGSPAILDGLAAYLAYWKAEETEQQYIPHPSKWLNQGQYLDELANPEKPFTQQEKDEIAAFASGLSQEEQENRRRNKEYPYDDATQSRM